MSYAPSEGAGPAQTGWGFTAEQVDGNGLVYLRARYYAPWVGRFSQLDPSRGEANLFVYVQGNPINRVDPSGHQSEYPTEPTQPTLPGGILRDETATPYWWEIESSAMSLSSQYQKHYLEFEPRDNFLGIPEAEYVAPNENMPPQWRYLEDGCDINLCHSVAFSAISYMTGHNYTPSRVYQTLGELYPHLACGEPLPWQYLLAIAQYYRWYSELQAVTTESDFFYQEVRQRLGWGQKGIALVGICGHIAICGSYNTPNSWLGRITAYNGGNGHFVVITGLSESSRWQAGTAWKWIRIYDPFDNQTEYHPAELFHSYLVGNLVWVYPPDWSRNPLSSLD